MCTIEWGENRVQWVYASESNQQLESDGTWEIVNVTPESVGMPKGEPDVLFQAWTYRIRPR